MLPISKARIFREGNMEKKETYFVDIDGTIFKYRQFETRRSNAKVSG